jgi:hypothetical protein
MARQSVEAKAAAAWRAAATTPSIDLPSYLDKAAKSLWVSIVSSKPADWFDQGSYALLVEYCQITARHKSLSENSNPLRNSASCQRSNHRGGAVRLAPSSATVPDPAFRATTWVGPWTSGDRTSRRSQADQEVSFRTGTRGKSPGRAELTRLRRAGMDPTYRGHVGAGEDQPFGPVARRA